MNNALWIAQGLLAFIFLAAGSMKVFAFDTFARQMDWARPMGWRKVAGIGAAEIAGAIGVILPMALGVAAFLTPLAALGLATIMALATAFHARRGETAEVARNVLFFAVAAFVTWGRWDLLTA